MFILHMTNKKVQEKLGTEPKEPEQALKIATVFEEGIKRQKSYGTQITDTSKTSVKSQPIFALERTKQRECFRCDESNITMEHIRNCKAANYKCKTARSWGTWRLAAIKIFPNDKKR